MQCLQVVRGQTIVRSMQTQDSQVQQRQGSRYRRVDHPRLLQITPQAVEAFLQHRIGGPFFDDFEIPVFQQERCSHTTQQQHVRCPRKMYVH